MISRKGVHLLAKKSFVERMEETTDRAFATVSNAVNEMYPEDVILKSILDLSFEVLTPEQKKALLEQAGPEFFLELVAKIEKRVAKFE